MYKIISFLALIFFTMPLFSMLPHNYTIMQRGQEENELKVVYVRNKQSEYIFYVNNSSSIIDLKYRIYKLSKIPMKDLSISTKVEAMHDLPDLMSIESVIKIYRTNNFFLFIDPESKKIK